MGPFGSIYMISQYSQFSQDPETHMDHLDHVLGALSSKSLVVGLDANGVSPMWSARARVPDSRGQLLDEIIVGHGLQPLNRPNCLSTIRTGERDIDVSLATPDLGRLSEWTVLDDWTSSDHRTLLITITGAASGVRSGPTRFNIKRAKWPKYKDNLERLVTNLSPNQALESGLDIERYATTLGSLLVDAANGAIPIKRRFGKSVPWWNNDLTHLKKEVNRLRRAYQKERSRDEREASRSRYLTLRKRYTAAAFSARTNSWRNFAEENTRSNAYGVVYKILNQRMSPVSAVNTIQTGNGYTDSWESTASAMLDGLFRGPDGSEVTDPDECRQLGEDIPDWSENKVRKAVKSLKNGKCPGEDRIEPEMVKVACSTSFLHALTKLLNGCLRTSHFPKCWKTGSIRILLKGVEKDPANIKSYRPICLLSLISKVLEILMREALRPVVLNRNFASPRQFGFRQRRSTVDAIRSAFETVRLFDKKIVFGILYDITGAFDNISWGSILGEMSRRGCPRNLWSLLQSYLSDRSMKISCPTSFVTKQLGRGCPQGSVLGPDLWNVCLDPLLQKIAALGGEVFAYADDLLLLVDGGSRGQCEVKGQSLTDVIVSWATSMGLQLSKAKTEMILLNTGKNPSGRQVESRYGYKKLHKHGSCAKGGSRPPTIRLSPTEKGISYKTQVRYLGLNIGENLSIGGHVAATATKAGGLFQRLASALGADWGIGFDALKVIYSGVYLPTMLYAIGAWGGRIGKTLQTTLNQRQRPVLLRISRAYRTASTDALQVLTGIRPLDLECQRWFLRYLVSKGIAFDSLNVAYRQDASETKGDKVEEMQGGGVGSLKDPKLVLQQQKLPKNQKAATERERELRMRQLAAAGKKGKGKGKNARDRSPLSSEVSATDGGDDSKVSEMEVGHESEEDETRERDVIRRKKKRRKTRSGSGSVSGEENEERSAAKGAEVLRKFREIVDSLNDYVARDDTKISKPTNNQIQKRISLFGELFNEMAVYSGKLEARLQAKEEENVRLWKELKRYGV
ncbi:unnamed protein product [Trichogramma brassicae]|uniref:Reverse transcriptase domain-containing protein n=1 Tax=Trichogramma brassicae TaxID=86971 RepID=A0A6H5IAD7_9HYME|nr:unnamed protein product [Trichogramma brassicae]